MSLFGRRCSGGSVALLVALVACGEARRPYTYDLAPALAAPPRTSSASSDDVREPAARTAHHGEAPEGPTAILETSLGTLTCALFVDKAPKTVENFVGLATGRKAWLDPRTQRWTERAAYDGTSFHRVIPGFVIQGGDPRGDGRGEPGFTIADEIWEGARHDKAGQLCMANRGPNTNGMQFFITDAAVPHLDGGYTIFGECAELEVVHAIANTPRDPHDAPLTRVDIVRVTIR